MSIQLYDFNYNLLAECDRAFLREWDLKFNGIGTFEGSFERNGEFSRVMTENENVILTDGQKQAICVAYKLDDKLHIYGRTPEWLLSKRVVLPFKSRELCGASFCPPEQIVIKLLESAYVTPKIVNKSGTVSGTNTAKISNEIIIPELPQSVAMNRYFWRNAANPLSEVIFDLCKIANCGCRLRFCPEERCWKFEFVKGRELDIIISKSLKNAYDMSYQESVLKKARDGYFQIGSEDEEGRNYGCISQTSDNGAGLLYWEEVLASASGESEAESELEKCVQKISLDCEVINAEYEKDYILGDILRVQAEFGNIRHTLKRRVDGVSIVINANGKSTKPSFTDV